VFIINGYIEGIYMIKIRRGTLNDIDSLVDLRLDPEYRHNGIATGFLKEMLLYLKETGVKHVFLHATDDGRKVYEKLGFKAKQSEMEMYL